jgi:hypothetical protein
MYTTGRHPGEPLALSNARDLQPFDEMRVGPCERIYIPIEVKTAALVAQRGSHDSGVYAVRIAPLAGGGLSQTPLHAAVVADVSQRMVSKSDTGIKRRAAGGAVINDRSTEVPQVERESAQLVELLEGLEDQLVNALADNQVDSDEAKGLHLGIQTVYQAALAHDESSAIGIAIIRTGITSQRSQRLLRHRHDREMFLNAGSPEAA